MYNFHNRQRPVLIKSEGMRYWFSRHLSDRCPSHCAMDENPQDLDFDAIFNAHQP
jgi:hypothetical protein